MDIFCEYCIVAPYNQDCQCTKTGDYCLYVYRCEKEKRNRPMSQMVNCKFKQEPIKLGKGEYKVRFEHKGKLYVEVDNQVIVFKNPFDYIPQIVKLKKVNGEYRIKGA